MPKALILDDGGSWPARAVAVLLDGGCSAVAVVLGARASEASALLPENQRVSVVLADDWAHGMSASLRAGLAAVGGTDAVAAVITLVDLPDLPGAAVRRITADAAASDLRQATYHDRPGHPVLIGREHWPALIDNLSGDSGARDYLERHDAVRVDCTDLWHGDDVDRR